MPKPSAKRITANIKKGVPRKIAVLEEYARVGKLRGYGKIAKEQLHEAVARQVRKR